MKKSFLLNAMLHIWAECLQTANFGNSFCDKIFGKMAFAKWTKAFCSMLCSKFERNAYKLQISANFLAKWLLQKENRQFPQCYTLNSGGMLTYCKFRQFFVSIFLAKWLSQNLKRRSAHVWCWPTLLTFTLPIFRPWSWRARMRFDLHQVRWHRVLLLPAEGKVRSEDGGRGLCWVRGQTSGHRKPGGQRPDQSHQSKKNGFDSQQPKIIILLFLLPE